jgi:hypothetical protein
MDPCGSGSKKLIVTPATLYSHLCTLNTTTVSKVFGDFLKISFSRARCSEPGNAEADLRGFLSAGPGAAAEAEQERAEEALRPQAGPGRQKELRGLPRALLSSRHRETGWER